MMKNQDDNNVSLKKQKKISHNVDIKNKRNIFDNLLGLIKILKSIMNL